MSEHSKPYREPFLDLLLERIGAAARLAADAERIFCAGGDFGTLRAAADRAHCDLLASLCRLSDEEADHVEPAFTDLETRLLRLAALPPTGPEAVPKGTPVACNTR